MKAMMKEFQLFMIQYTTKLINTLDNKNRSEYQDEVRLSQVYDETINSEQYSTHIKLKTTSSNNVSSSTSFISNYYTTLPMSTIQHGPSS